MNKKFSTLMAGLMLASAFSVSAQTNNAATQVAVKYETGKYYMLGTKSDGVLVVESTPGADYGDLYLSTAPSWNLEQTREALWQVTVTAGKEGDAPKYAFVNVATGMTLGVKTPSGSAAEDAKVTGNYMEWLDGFANSFGTDSDKDGKVDGGYTSAIPEMFFSYINSTDVVYFVAGTTSGTRTEVQVKKSSYATAASNNPLEIMPFLAETVALTADDLNKELITNNEDKESFTLSFDQDVTEGAENLFTGVELVAEQLYFETSSGSTSTLVQGKKDDSNYTQSEYVQIHVKDTKNYLVVDTALHTGSEALKQLPKFTYADPSVKGSPIEGNNISRYEKAFNFKFAYEPLNDRVLIKVQGYPTRVANANGTPVTVEGEDGNDAYTYWPTGTYNTSETADPVEDAYVRLVTLSSVRELTVAADEADGESSKEWSDPDDLENGMLTTVKIGEGLMAFQPTTIDNGLYLIQFVKNSANEEAAEGNYFVANLGGAFGYAEQARNQVYDHMPAAQWYVQKDGENSAAMFTITNREFFDQKGYDQNNDGTAEALLGDAFKYRAFATDEPGVVFFRDGAFKNDTVKFIKVSDASQKDAKLGYKYVDEETSTVETYVFNYLHGLAASSEVGLNTPIAKDSLVRVDETGETIAFRLVPVVVDDSYGKQFDEKKQGIANLIRNAYYIKAYDEIKFAEDNRDRYLTYDTKSKKYVMSTTPTAYFLKENNCVGDVHYYALVEANLFKANNKKAVRVDGEVVIPRFNNPLDNVIFYPASLAGQSVKDGAKSDEVKAYEAAYNSTDGDGVVVYFYDKNGKFIATDASTNVPVYGYYPNDEQIIELQLIHTEKSDTESAKYYYMNATGDDYENYFVAGTKSNDVWTQTETGTTDYADNRVSVDDNTLDLTIANIEDKWNDEIRVSAFAVVENDAPLYRRFNGAAPETYGTAANAPLNLKFYRYNNNQEFLFENYSSENSYRNGITDNSISFLGLNNASQFPESEVRSYTMYVDTAYVRNNTRMPQYLIAVKPEVVEGDTTLCDASTHQHATPEEALACEHSIIRPYFVRAMYLFNAQDSIDAKNYDYQGKAAYGAQGYTRLAFKDAVHAMDTLYILNPGVTTEQLVEANFKNEDLFADKIFLGDNMHKNVVFQFRLLDEQDNRFLIESEAEKDGKAVLNSELDHVCIAPNVGGWLKIQNGVPVIARDLTFNEASSQADVFDVTDEIQYDAVDNEEIAVEGVSVVAGDGQVTIMGAAGKNVTITNILGKVIASQVIASDNATIAVPAGIVAVAVEGEAAVKAIVK